MTTYILASLLYSLISPLRIAALYSLFNSSPSCLYFLFVGLILYLSGHSTLNPRSCQAVLFIGCMPHFIFKKGFTVVFGFLWLCRVFAATWAVSGCGERGDSVAVIRRFLATVASLLQPTGSRMHGFQCQWLAGLNTGSGAMATWAQGCTRTKDCTRLLPYQAGSLPLSHKGNPQVFLMTGKLTENKQQHNFKLYII